MAVTIRPETFTITEVKTTEYTVKKSVHSYTVEKGTVEMSLRGKTVIANAWRFAGRDDGRLSVDGFVGRYVTSPKPWRASVDFKADGTMGFVHFGRDDRSGRFNKQNAIAYQPETYAAI